MDSNSRSIVMASIEYSSAWDSLRTDLIAKGTFLDAAMKGVSVVCALMIIVILGGIALALFVGSIPALLTFGTDFLFSSAWNPETGEFGALSSIYGTCVSTLIALIIAIPLSLAISVFLVELSHPLIRQIVGAVIELLAVMPSILFGMWGLFILAPLMAKVVQPFLAGVGGSLPFFEGPQIGVNMLTAGVVLSIMILPFMSVVMRDIFLMVPPHIKEATYGLGATSWEVTRDVTLRYGREGVLGACLLGMGRAFGEAVAVLFVIGNSSRMSLSLFDPGNSLASRLANRFAEASDPLYVSALMELGLLLFLLTLTTRMVTRYWLKRIHAKMRGDLP